MRLQTSKLICSFKAELGKSDFLKQDNLSMVKHLLLRAEKQLDWNTISLSFLQVSPLQLAAIPAAHPCVCCGITATLGLAQLVHCLI